MHIIRTSIAVGCRYIARRQAAVNTWYTHLLKLNHCPLIISYSRRAFKTTAKMSLVDPNIFEDLQKKIDEESVVRDQLKDILSNLEKQGETCIRAVHVL